MLMITAFSYAQPKTGFSFAEKGDQKGIDLLFNGKLLTAYCYYDSIKKPFLWPVNTLDGITVTRGFPIKPVAGERTDHPHHVGVWMNYEAVNGLDFWNHSTAIPFEKRSGYGTIVHDKVVATNATGNKAELTATAKWIRPDGHVLLQEQTTYAFHVTDNNFFIDRTTTLTANDLDVQFKDVKDGFIAIRVARELEQPSTQADVFVDANGNKTEVPKINNEGVTGNYLTSEGITGDAAWSTRGPWTALQGKKEGKDITIAIFDHPQNIGYPAYRHARGYGLFAINPLGQNVFSNGKESLNFSLKPGAAVTFRYRMLVTSGKAPITTGELERIAEAFGKQQ
jgi:hypothetical protein